MSSIDSSDLAFVEAVTQLPYVNPFLRERVRLEQQALGDDFVDVAEVWHFDADSGPNPNHREIEHRTQSLLPRLRSALESSGAGASGTGSDSTSQDELEQLRRQYRDLGLYSLYTRYQGRFFDMLSADANKRRRASFYDDFEEDYRRLFQGERELELPDLPPPDLLFAWFFQVRRAFHNIFRSIVGGSMSAAELRAAVWQSIFSHDMRRFRSGLYRRMGDSTTLITGPSGTGKELVARAIGLSRFIPFDAGRGNFVEDYNEAFYALNLSALSPTLIESELFGHKRGAFTGALVDRRGWFEVCPALGAVFLDEIGEVDEAIQVKLLRVLETRTFQRLGETEDRHFRGKLIAATNRDPEEAMRSGRMREDFYYRLCSDRIETPSLRAQLEDAPDELPGIIRAVVSRIVDASAAEELAQEVLSWIELELGSDYSWPGNFRELEQCARNVLIRGEYRPALGGADRPSGALDAIDEALLRPLRAGSLGAEQVVDLYVTWMYARTGSYVGAAERLGLDRRTVKSRIDSDWLERFASQAKDPGDR